MQNTSSRAVVIPSFGAVLEGDLTLPDLPRGIVVFAHGSGSSRRSSRNRYVAEVLQRAGFATLLFDLLTETEDLDHNTRFDIPLLSRRLEGTVRWVESQHELAQLPVGIFGASTGAAAALEVAASLGHFVCAVVSRGGRPDLAIPSLHHVSAPTLFIVGGRDAEVLELNRKAMEALPDLTQRKLEIVEGATHLFEETDALEQVARLATDWFRTFASGDISDIGI